MPRAGAFNKINMWDRHAASSTCLRQYFEKGIIRMPQAVRGRRVLAKVQHPPQVLTRAKTVASIAKLVVPESAGGEYSIKGHKT